MQEIYVSGKHLKHPIQFKLIVKNESVETYGYIEVWSGLFAKTLKVAQHPSTASHLNTEEVPSLPSKV